MEPLTTQTFSGDETQAPATSADSLAALPALPDETHAVPFRDFGISEAISSGLEAAGIFTTFPIQALTLPLALGGQDIIGQARTGTGKTLAFGVPLLQLIEEHGQSRTPQSLVVVPTRELAIQVADDLRVAAVNLRAKVLTVYGGRAYEPQIDALTAGVDIVVGTPGRLLDLAERRHLDLSSVRALVLDEADKMLDLGFLPDVERIVRLTPQERQTMLFSATMPGDVVTLARRHMRQPTNIRAEGHDAPAPVPSTEQHVFRAHQMDKIEVLARVLQARNRGLTIVFCQTKRAADQVADALATRGFAVATVHGDLGQGQRERALRAFRSGKVDVLTATEVAARGLDVDDVTHVVNYECPDDEKTYVHRIGRTGRAGRPGVAVTFVDWRDMHRWKLINDGAEPGHGRAGGDLLHLGEPLRRTGHPARGDGDAPPRDAGAGRAGGRSHRGHRRDRQDPLAQARLRGAGLRGPGLRRPRLRRPDAEEHGGWCCHPGRRHGRTAAPPDQGGPRDRHGGIRRTAAARGAGRSGAGRREDPGQCGGAGPAAASQAADVRQGPVRGNPPQGLLTRVPGFPLS